ncbi:hypothetical protein [Alkaliphilus transvaalensis]|uniref:hypothetical protein n=1 Tax=Alkaliphilus transvaalensis TaxID=114628 RepID=UPI00047D369A|nr:hypothetical protein [Alkaliphilus transvaalensis]
MDMLPISFVIFITIPEVIVKIFLGLQLIGVKPPIKRVIIAGILQGIAVYFIRNYYEYDLSFILQTIIAIFLTFTIVRVRLLCSLLVNLIGTAIAILVETAYLIIFLKVTQLTYVEIISREWLRVASLAPKIVILLLILIMVIKSKITIEEEISFLGKINKHIKM